MNPRVLVYAVALAGGFWLGNLPLVLDRPPPPVAAASESVTLRVHPGPEQSLAALTCSWHAACTNPPSAGSALDWANGHASWAPDRPILWRSRGFRSNPNQFGAIATGQIIQADGVCAALRVAVIDVFGFSKGYISYVHSRTWTPGWQFSINGSSSWQWSVEQVGFSWSTEFPSCVAGGYWTGQHLHQDRDLTGWWAVNWANFTSAGVRYAISSPENWQYQQSWTWNY
ncbi:MAG: hypothetical protein WHT63_09465 [Tepidiforma sp.]